jgi:hypothetical protein
VSTYGQRFPRAAADEVALQLGEHHGHVRHRLAHRPAKSSVQRLARSTFVKIGATA